MLRFPGIGLSAKAIEQGGGDLILVYNSGRFRMAGRGSLAGLMPFSDANQVVVEMVGFLRKSTATTAMLMQIGQRGAAHCAEHARSRRRLWH